MHFPERKEEEIEGFINKKGIHMILIK